MVAPTLDSHEEREVVCKLCRRQLSKYTCPGCNIPYCSLTCFRSPEHSQCSESFYKKEVESDIRSEPSKTAEERLKMIELLKRFEEESGQDESFLDEDEEEDELVKRFGDVDLESISPDELWSMLKPDERTKFLAALNNPSGELAQQLLVSEQLDSQRHDPWWENWNQTKQCNADDAAEENDNALSSIQIPVSMLKTEITGPPLIYNLCTILIAYVYATRHLALSSLSSLGLHDEDRKEARRLISQLVPFLVNRSATTLHKSLSSVVTDIMSRFDDGSVAPRAFSVLLHDAARLLRPMTVTKLSNKDGKGNEYVDVASHPHILTVLAISDLSHLFEHPCSLPKKDHVVHKLVFYAAHALSLPSVVLLAVSQEVDARATSYATQEDAVEKPPWLSSDSSRPMNPDLSTNQPSIEEI